MPEEGYKSKYEIKVECVITVPFHAEDPLRPAGNEKEYRAARKRDEQAVRDIMRYIRGALRDELSCIPFANNENESRAKFYETGSH